MVDEIEILEHGSTHRDDEETQEQYPFQLCPECMSQNTRVCFDSLTGSCKYETEKIFLKKIVFVNHKCEDCGCQWQHKYEDEEFRKCKEVNPDIVAGIAAFLVWIFSLFSTICAWNVVDCYTTKDDVPGLVILWVILSSMISIIGMVGFSTIVSVLLRAKKES